MCDCVVLWCVLSLLICCFSLVCKLFACCTVWYVMFYFILIVDMNTCLVVCLWVVEVFFGCLDCLLVWCVFIRFDFDFVLVLCLCMFAMGLFVVVEYDSFCVYDLLNCCFLFWVCGLLLLDVVRFGVVCLTFGGELLVVFWVDCLVCD